MATKRRRIKKVRRTKTPMWRRKYSELSPRHRSKRRLALETLSIIRRKGLSLTKASRRTGISRRTVRRHVGSALRKKGRRWLLGKRDRVPRLMKIYENGQELPIEIADYQTASNIGKYHSIISRFLDTGNESILNEAQSFKYIRDVYGRTHELELRPDVLYKIATKRAEPELFQIYHE
ncbi:hypothetical protein A3K80_03875 [Candidatus Bathyarchaeota archaeon RBG_13_38_9]|nr:MAG: hypothetical protein A3K80_03875 [Candidatus Bathyarchaeota archaeon RBG_13_38_9]